MFVRALLVMVMATTLSACHDDACEWSIVDARAEQTAALRADSEPRTITATTVRASSTRSSRTDVTTSVLSVTLDVAGDPELDVVNLTVDLGDLDRAPAELALATAELRLGRAKELVGLLAPSAGTLSLDSLDVRCELSMSRDGGGRFWRCATSAAGSLTARFVHEGRTYDLDASFAYGEGLSEECYECRGFEGCSY